MGWLAITAGLTAYGAKVRTWMWNVVEESNDKLEFRGEPTSSASQEGGYPHMNLVKKCVGD